MAFLSISSAFCRLLFAAGDLFCCFRFADLFDRRRFVLVVLSYLIFRVGEGFSRLRVFVRFSAFLVASFCFLPSPFVCRLWPSFGLIFSSFSLHFCPIYPSLFTVFVFFAWCIWRLG